MLASWASSTRFRCPSLSSPGRRPGSHSRTGPFRRLRPSCRASLRTLRPSGFCLRSQHRRIGPLVETIHSLIVSPVRATRRLETRSRCRIPTFLSYSFEPDQLVPTGRGDAMRSAAANRGQTQARTRTSLVWRGAAGSLSYWNHQSLQEASLPVESSVHTLETRASLPRPLPV